MPFYEYRCNECGEAFEKMLRFSEADQLPVCPKCESSNTQKKLSRVISWSVPLQVQAALLAAAVAARAAGFPEQAKL
ncbi:MAG: zinc ribbon domain-containing protein [Leptolinea sp.]